MKANIRLDMQLNIMLHFTKNSTFNVIQQIIY